MFGIDTKEEGSITPQIKMFDLASEHPNSHADLTMKKTGYVRVREKLAKLLKLDDADWIVFGQFGSQLLIARRPEGAFGHVTLKKRGESRSISWYGTSKKVTKELGESNYNLDDETPVTDQETGIEWFKLVLFK